MHDEISPLDGRYKDRLAGLGDYFSEFALMRSRCEVELRYLLSLDETGLFPPFEPSEREGIERRISSFSADDFSRIKTIEEEIDHDVKACEIFLREALRLRNPNLIHFGLTSEDINNLAYGIILTRYRDEVQLPQLDRLIEALADLTARWKDVAFPSRTHGQPASPTTAGKEIAVFLSRLLRQGEGLKGFRFQGKLNGATGNYSAFYVAFPDYDWEGFAERFVSSLGLKPNPATTQIEDGDRLSEYFAIVLRINTILLDLDSDIWEYISRGEMRLAARPGEVGSSTMPHKVNPIHFENSEGNAKIANALLQGFMTTLPRSRMQRDLSGSTVRRNIGVALAHSYLAIEETIDGLGEIDLNREAISRTLEASPEVLTEAYQTILRAKGYEDPYELFREAVRGRRLTIADLHGLIDRLDIDKDLKRRLRGLSVQGYTGRAARIAERIVAEARGWLDGRSER